MSTSVGTTTEPWSIKERLCLASSVVRSGDQNWVSVSRAIKPLAEPLRQPDFFSQRNCARQYSVMLENVETPKRKRTSERGEVVETPGDLIVRKMTMERMDELKAQIREDKARFKQLKKEIDEIRSGTLDDKLQSMLDDIQGKKKAATKEESEAPKSAGAEIGKTVKTTLSTAAAGKARRPPSRPSKPSRTSEGSSGEPGIVDASSKQSEDCDLDSVFDHPSGASSSDALSSSLTSDKQKTIAQRQKQGSNSSSVGGTEGSDVDVTAISDVAKTLAAGSPTLSKLLTPRGKSTSSTSSTPPADTPGSHQPLLSAAAKATAAKEAAKILLGGVVGGRGGEDESSEVCGSRGFQSVFSSFVKSDTPKIDVEICDPLKNLDAAEDSDNSQIPTEPSSPSRPDASEVRGKKKSRGRPPSSSRRSGRSKGRSHADGDDTSDRHSESFADDDARDEAHSETADSDRPSESDREDASSVVTGSLQQSMFVDSMPGSPSSITAEHEHDHTYRIWRKAIMLVWRTIASHKYANIFLHPVTNDIAPGYEGIVHRPINLTRIKKNVENGTIRTTEQFHRDILLMFQNAIMYNSRDHDVYRMASDMQNDAVQYIEEFMSTQLMVQQPDSVKMLRSKDGGSRRIDAANMSGKEDEKPRRGSSEVETSGKKRRTRADEY